MKMINIHTVEEKREWWGEGPWLKEPDRIEFEHLGVSCLIVRMVIEETMGHKFGGYFCGYCRIPEGHRFFDKLEEYIDVSVHGGITFADFGGHESIHGFKQGEYWIGFDCAHSSDIIPSLKKVQKDFYLYNEFKKSFPDSSLLNPTYKEISFAIGECKDLASQISTLQS